MTPEPIAAVCHTDYEPASRSSGHRAESEIRWIVLHDAEAPNARGVASYFHDPRDPAHGGPGGSAHLTVDDDRCYRSLANTVIPWGAASSFGANTHGFHIEQAGYARWSAVVWRSHLRTLKRAAYKTAIHAHRFKVPLVFVTAAELPGRRGITTHAEVTAASKRLDPTHAWAYDHTDPGRLWPRALFMRYVRQYAARL